jgi:hypothetical protein
MAYPTGRFHGRAVGGFVLGFLAAEQAREESKLKIGHKTNSAETVSHYLRDENPATQGCRTTHPNKYCYQSTGMGRRAFLIRFLSRLVFIALAQSVSTGLLSDIALELPFATFSQKSTSAPSRLLRFDRLRLSMYVSTPFFTPRLTRRTARLTRFSISVSRLDACEEPFLFFLFFTLTTTGAPTTTVVSSGGLLGVRLVFLFTFLVTILVSLLVR